jgi:aminoglycoside phosphotransferase (APT) family kinase protein
VGAGQLHDGELGVDADLVRRLITSQHPQWATLAVKKVPAAGTDNAMFRLGADLAVRLPRVPWVEPQVDKEQRWLPVLAPLLPLPVPVPVAAGAPGEGYPWRWSVCQWLDGVSTAEARLRDPVAAATRLGRFVVALRDVDPTGGPAPGEHNFGRGAPLATRDAEVRAALAQVGDLVDVAAAASAWDSALAAPPWPGPPTWLHGDLAPGNLVLRDGALAGVIDFGGLGVGDPACDLMVGWHLFRGPSREAYRVASSLDDDSWARGRGWALSMALIALPYYRRTSSVVTASSLRTITEVLADGS